MLCWFMFSESFPKKRARQVRKIRNYAMQNFRTTANGVCGGNIEGEKAKPQQ